MSAGDDELEQLTNYLNSFLATPEEKSLKLSEYINTFVVELCNRTEIDPRIALPFVAAGAYGRLLAYSDLERTTRCIELMHLEFAKKQRAALKPH